VLLISVFEAARPARLLGSRQKAIPDGMAGAHCRLVGLGSRLTDAVQQTRRLQLLRSGRFELHLGLIRTVVPS
jgi:hypothetical protein